MEQEEEFKKLVATLKGLEKHKEALSEPGLSKAKSEAYITIEQQFERCMLALALRKEELIREVDSEFSRQEALLDSQKVGLNTSLEQCRKIMEAGASVYNLSSSAAISIWKNAAILAVPKEVAIGLEVRFKEDVVNIIHSHGSVSMKREDEPEVSKSPVTVSTLKDPLSSRDTYINHPRGIFFHGQDKTLYICNSGCNMVQKVSVQGDSFSFVARYKVECPFGMAFSHNSFYVSSFNANRVYVLDQVGNATQFNTKGSEKIGMYAPAGVAVDPKTGDIFVCECEGHVIRKITPQGVASVLAGAGKVGFMDGDKTAQFNHPWGICYNDKHQALYVCDRDNHKIRKVLLTGEVTTACEFRDPGGITTITNGAMLVSSPNRHIIAKIILNEKAEYEVETIAGCGTSGNVDGIALDSRFNYPTGLAYDAQSNICYVADWGNSEIRKISPV